MQHLVPYANYEKCNSAEDFARRGCKVYATARKVEKMSGLSASIEQLELDVLDDTSVKKAVAVIIEREGRIDILVNNAGMGSVSQYTFITISRSPMLSSTRSATIGSHGRTL
jgi:NADP-dependent 3-hydroxy acid dehydrogenase YdfG